MVITIPNSTLGEKIVSSSSEPLLDLFEDKFSPTLGGDLKVCSIPTVMKKNLEYNPESAPRRIAYDEICCAVNPHKSVLSRSHHIENTKKISVGRLMRFGCKINYLKRRRRRQRLVSLPDKFLFTPSSHGMEIFEPVLSNSATGQHITAPSFPPFKLIECKFLIAPGRNINGWKLSPANLSPVMNEDHRSKGIAYEKSTSRVERSGCKINYLRRRRQILAAHENRKKLAPTPNKPATFLIAPGVSVKAGSVEYKDGSPRPRIAYEESCRDEPVLSIMNKYGSPRPRKESCLDEPVLSNCDGDKIAPPCALTEPRFKFTECHEASLFPGRTIKIRTMSDTQNMGNTSVMKSVGNLNDLTSPLPRGILYQTSCIEAKTKSEGLDDEQTSSSLASCIEEITKHVEFLKEELGKPYTSRHCLKWADLLFSWIPKTGALPPYVQVSGECWAVALQRGRAYYMAANGIKGKELTIKCLLEGVSRKHLKSSGGLVGFESAKDFLVAEGYVKDMIVHRRPLGANEFAGYEILLEKLLARGPVVVVYDTIPGYDAYDGKSIYIPDEKICEFASFERFNQHSVVVTGCGVGLVEEKPIEFWQTHDSQKPEWGVNGFGQLARGCGLIVAAVEFEF